MVVVSSFEEKKEIENNGRSVVLEMGDCNRVEEEKRPLNEDLKIEDEKNAEERKQESIFTRFVLTRITAVYELAALYKTQLGYGVFGMLILGYCIYLICAILNGFQQAIPLIIVSAVALLIVIYELVSPKIKRDLANAIKKREFSDSSLCRVKRIRCVLFWVVVLAFFAWLFIDIVLHNPRQLISLGGLVLILFVCSVFSKYPQDINWKPVLWGILLQFILGLLVLRTRLGYASVKFIGDQVALFMTYTDAGSSFVFGKDTYVMHYFAFKVLPMIIFFSTIMNMLYYLGLMQWFIGKLAWLTQVSLGTSAIESTVAAANIFVGMTEAPLVVRPYLEQLTEAEIHSVLTCGLGSIAFSVFGAFIGFGVSSVHLLTACVMSAPASLAISRLLFPERSRSKYLTTKSLVLSGKTDRNIVEAAAAGASMSICLVANIAANLIAFLALLAFINSILSWFGGFVGHPYVTFQVICGYIFMPLAYLMGADWEDCGLVGELFGMKTFLNEFIAYKTMGPYINNRLAGGPKFANDTIQYMSERSEVVAIHALCGFCNVSSLGIIIGGLGSLMPSRKQDLASLAVRSLIGGILTCCMTASISSLLFMESEVSVIVGNVTDIPELSLAYEMTTVSVVEST